MPIEDVLDIDATDDLYCLSSNGVAAIRRVLGYLTRQITYLYEAVDDAYYLGATDLEFQDILDEVSRLEGQLMSPCDFSEIVTAIDANTAAIAALQCICTQMDAGRVGDVFGPDVSGLIDGGLARPIMDVPSETIPAQGDDDACAIAQLYWSWTFEVITEQILPAWDSAFDDLIPILAGIIGEIIGPAPGDGIPIYAVAELLQELIEIGYSSARENLINWLYAVKEEWVCEAYSLIKEGSSSSAIAQAVKDGIIDTALDISFGDKVVLAFFGGPWAVSLAKRAFENETIWAADNVEPGFCADCEPSEFEYNVTIPCVEVDWLTGDPPTCHNGMPRCYASAGFIRHIGGTLRPAATDLNRYQVKVLGDGGPTPIVVNATLYLPHTGGQIPLFTGETVGDGETKTIEGTFNTPYPGELHQLQVTNSPNFLYVLEYGFAPPE